MKVSFIIPARNKATHVAECVRTVLAQTYSPMEIVLSDQGSEDETLAILTDLAGSYDGPNRVRMVQCPIIERKGMPGLNDHLNWLDTQIEGDIVIQCSADDLNHPRRAEFTVRAFQEFNPSYVNTAVQFLEADGSDAMRTDFPNRASRFLGIAETIKHQIGSNGSSAWARDLYTKCTPLIGYEQQDIILPMMALIDRGIYFIDLPLHTYVKHAGLENTGFQGQMAAASHDKELLTRIVEVNNFAHVRNWTSVFDRWQQAGRMPHEGIEPLMEKITTTAHAWANVREALLLTGLALR